MGTKSTRAARLKKRAAKSRPAPSTSRTAAPDRSTAAGSASASEGLREGWNSALQALAEAEGRVETQIRALLRTNKIKVEDATELLREFRAGVERERQRGMKELEVRLGGLQQRVREGGREVVKLADDAVQSGLAALNIPSRREVTLLTRKVDELSQRIGGLRRRKK